MLVYIVLKWNTEVDSRQRIFFSRDKKRIWEGTAIVNVFSDMFN